MSTHSLSPDRRSPRFHIGDAVVPNDSAPKEYRGRPGRVTEVGISAFDYRVEFEDGLLPTTGYLKTTWLRR